MNRVLALFWTLLLVTAVALPSFGPLVDHHFAERLPSHRHLGAATTHSHTFNLAHDEAGNPTGATTAVYNHDSGLSNVVSMAIDASLLGAVLRPKLSSSVNLPTADTGPFRTRYAAPPDRPPRLTL